MSAYSTQADSRSRLPYATVLPAYVTAGPIRDRIEGRRSFASGESQLDIAQRSGLPVPLRLDRTPDVA